MNAPEAMLEQIERLVCERQALRARSAGEDELERNRSEIVRCQWVLSHALIARHRPDLTARRAA
jgi:hypothetical protein